MEAVDAWEEPEALVQENPLSTVPTLALHDGRSLFDSAVICEYLDRQHAGRAMIPKTGELHCQVLLDQALADGIMACAELIVVERERRPEALKWDQWVALKQRAIERSLDRLEQNAETLTDRVDLGAISVAVALGYLDSSDLLGDWRESRPALASWYEEFSQRPSMTATAPQA